METEFYGDERDYELGGIYYDGPMYLSEVDEEEFDDAPDYD